MTTGQDDSELGIDSAIIHAQVASQLFGDVVQVRIARYPVLRKLGEGGMGTVFAAYDEALDRRIAIKLVRPVLDGDADAMLRLRREAQALAKVAHPNVVGVHEVGEHDGRVYIAMEFVKGSTLREWLGERERSIAEIVDAMVQTGRGLAAVHAEGIVHRDVKPENVMVEESGRVRVMDFGLARVGNDADLLSTLESSGRSVEDAVATADGAVIGTPAYMAPEQFRGELVDARTDAFSFCVMFWEALCGARPFAGRTITELGQRVMTGTREPFVPRRGVSSALRRAIERGLEVDPSARFVSMDALLAAITTAGSKRATRVLAVGSSAIVIAGAFALASRQEAAPCEGADALVAEAWSPSARAEVEGAFAASGVSFADDALAYATTQLDAYATSWVEQWTDACEATNVRGEQSTDLLDRRMACLDRAKVELAATVDVLEAADRKIVGRADKLVDALPWLPDCSDRERLLAEVAPPDDAALAEHVTAARERIAIGRVARHAGRHAVARAAFEEVLADPQTAAYPPLVAEATFYLGQIEDLDGQYDRAEQRLRDALSTALGSRAWVLASEISASLGYVVGAPLSRPTEALVSARLAHDLARAVAPGSRVEAQSLHVLGVIENAAGRNVEAEAYFRQALALREQVQGDDALDIAVTLNGLGNALGALGREKEAEQVLKRAVSVIESKVGPNHPLVLKPLNNMLPFVGRQGRIEEADAILQRMTTLAEAVHGPNHPEAAMYRVNRAALMGDPKQSEAELRVAIERLEAGIGAKHPAVAQAKGALSIALRKQGRVADAEVEARAALAITEELTPDDTRNIASLRDNLASCLAQLGRLEESEAEYAKALAMRETSLAADHPDVAMARLNYAIAMRRKMDYAAAETLLRKALADSEKSVTGDHPMRREMIARLGQTLADLGRHREAVDVLAPQWAHEDVAKPPTSPSQRGWLAWNLARARHGLGEDEEARALLERVEALFAEEPPVGEEEELARIEQARATW